MFQMSQKKVNNILQNEITALNIVFIVLFFITNWSVDITFKGVRLGKMVKIIKFMFFAQKVSSGMGALRPKFLGGYRH